MAHVKIKAGGRPAGSAGSGEDRPRRKTLVQRAAHLSTRTLPRARRFYRRATRRTCDPPATAATAGNEAPAHPGFYQ